ncbi:MAG TPA: hypothetical protein GX707_12350 [Epulopiscium sp.]|nr:hypothetical protein [Candidatus Epulonipiscium sp.]
MFDESQWGELNTHDPSIVKDGDTYYVFSTDASYGDIHKRGVQISDNNKEAHVALEIHLKDNKITGQRTGEYEIYNDYHIEMTIDGEIYDGVVIKQYDWEREEEVIAFTLMSEKGLAIWGSSKL